MRSSSASAISVLLLLVVRDGVLAASHERPAINAQPMGSSSSPSSSEIWSSADAGFWKEFVDFWVIFQLISVLVCLRISCTTTKKSTNSLQNPASGHLANCLWPEFQIGTFFHSFRQRRDTGTGSSTGPSSGTGSSCDGGTSGDAGIHEARRRRPREGSRPAEPSRPKLPET